eukprot:Gregarina_sp_Pseudo_9__1815@NODE_2234_length_1084_cov_20_225837_g2057_i0_p1_GENE_NODE_2234_length_1084_cov_20_225837_g2057_i0NODE_2234_length_1084_cov_20_225837_g2057_i0_p1_ORF_typecomplete_len304_score74_49MRPL28/PF09812_9/0_079_NODE_2234_length_1084_cov_20_225837_g2057_i0911002
MAASVNSLLEAILRLQKQQQECIKCLTQLLTSSKTLGTGSPAVSALTPASVSVSQQYEKEVRKACKSRQDYSRLCRWSEEQSAAGRRPFILLHKNNPLLAQRLQDPWPDVTPAPVPSADTAQYTVVPTEVPLIEDEIEIADDIAERFHALLFVKLLLFILLFDLDFEYMTVLIIIFFLHINGLFDPVVNFWRRRRHANRHNRGNEPLERVLQNLEQRRNIEREVQAANEALEEMRSPSPTRSETAAGETETGVPSLALTPTVPDTQPTDTQQPSYFGKVLYQTAGMFFGTLLPWWKPDQRYLS